MDLKPVEIDSSHAPVHGLIQTSHDSCDHAHGICHHNHDHNITAPTNNGHIVEPADHHGVLKWVFEKAGANDNNPLQRHRSKIALGASVGLACFEYGTLGALTPAGQTGMIVASALAAHDSSEDLMEAASSLKHTHSISGGVIGVAMGAAHTASEFFMTASATAGAYSDMAVSTTMGSNVSHIWLMAGVAGTIGAVSIDRMSAYKMNALALGSMTAAFGWQVATGQFNPYLSAGMMGGGLAFLNWRVRAGQTCATCDHNGEVLNQPDEKDYVSMSFMRETAQKISLKNCKQALERLSEKTKNLKQSLSGASIKGKLKNVFEKAVHPNVTALVTSLGALGLSAHIMGNNVVKLAESSSLSTTAMGASVAALAFALPELILTTKAAWKKEGEMAWGAISGCTVATVGIVGGYQGFTGFEVPENISLVAAEVTEGAKIQMAAFAGSAFTVIAALSPWGTRMGAAIDNSGANFLKNKWERASNWLRNDGTKIPKAFAIPMVGAAMTFYAASTQPICHSHGQSYHCYDPKPKPLPTAEEALKMFEGATDEQAAPDF